VSRHSLDRLAAVDRRLQASGARLCTLDPRRERPSTLRSIGERLLEDSGPELQEGFAVTLERVALCQLEHFAHNLFWDFDYLAACVLRAARQAPDAASELQQLGDELCELYSLFGSRSPIRFRYVHDFVYGMDWGRWVQSDPQAHAGNRSSASWRWHCSLPSGRTPSALQEQLGSSG
jgi:hypothetical protein